MLRHGGGVQVCQRAALTTMLPTDAAVCPQSFCLFGHDLPPHITKHNILAVFLFNTPFDE